MRDLRNASQPIQNMSLSSHQTRRGTVRRQHCDLEKKESKEAIVHFGLIIFIRHETVSQFFCLFVMLHFGNTSPEKEALKWAKCAIEPGEIEKKNHKTMGKSRTKDSESQNEFAMLQSPDP